MTKDETLCKRCGKSIPQQGGRGRPRVYCAEGDCAAQAKKTRALRRSTPGLEGALARAEDLYEQLETSFSAAITPLAEALRYELDPAGVEAKIAEVHAEAEARVRSARSERDDAQAETGRLRSDNAELMEEIATLTERVRDAQSAVEQSDAKASAESQRAEDAVAQAASDRGERDEAIEAAQAANEQKDLALTEAEEAREECQRAVESARVARKEAAAAGEAGAVARRAAEEARSWAEQCEEERDRSRETVREAQGQLQRALQLQAVAQSHAQRDRERAELAEEARLQADGERDRVLREVAVLRARLESFESVRSSDRELIERLWGEVDQWSQRCVAAEARLEGFSPGESGLGVVCCGGNGAWVCDLGYFSFDPDVA